MADNLSAAYYRAMATANAAIGEAISRFGADTTYEHIMSVLAESATRELPEGTHYLRNAVDEADRITAEMSAKPILSARRIPKPRTERI